eukprot:3269353-Pyramimonas_sp.AAC.1
MCIRDSPYGTTKRVGVGAAMGRRRHVGVAIWAFGGAPSGATRRVGGEPKRGGGAMRALPFGPS